MNLRLCDQCGQHPIATPIHFICAGCLSNIIVSWDDYGRSVYSVQMDDGELRPLVKSPLHRRVSG